MKKRLLLGIALILVVAMLVSGCGGKVAAKVNGEKITETELNKRVDQVAAMYGYDLTTEEGKSMVGFLKDQIIQSLIEEKVVLQEAKNRKIKATKDDVKKELEKIKTQFKDDAEYKAFLTERKFSEKDLTTFVEHQLVLNKLFDDVTKDLTATTRDVKQYYDENQPEFYDTEQIQARNIVVNTEDEAKAIIERLNKGEDFAALAVELSIDPTAKENKGDIGYFDKDAPLVDEFKNAAFQLKVGEYTKTPVKSTYGFHVIRVEDKKTARQRPFEEVKKELEDRFLMEEKNEKFSAYVDELLAKAKIEKTEPKEEPAKEGQGTAPAPAPAAPGTNQPAPAEQQPQK